MSDQATSFSGDGALQQGTITTTSTANGTAVTDVGLVAGNVVYVRSTGTPGHLLLCDGSSSAIAWSVVGVVGATYTNGDTATYGKSGQRVTGLSGLAPGVLYWSSAVGTLVTWDNVPSATWTRPMGVAISTSIIDVNIGDVRKKP